VDERETIRHLLTTSRTIAVVGLSSNPRKDSYIVAHHLHRYGYTLVPINPAANVILGRPAYPSISAIPPEVAAAVDLVVIFRPAEEVPGIVREALDHLPNLKGIWTQKNIVSPEAAELARSRGLAVVQDRCIRTQHLYLRFVAGVVPAETGADGG